jgi:hypothetical protein
MNRDREWLTTIRVLVSSSLEEEDLTPSRQAAKGESRFGANEFSSGFVRVLPVVSLIEYEWGPFVFFASLREIFFLDGK